MEMNKDIAKRDFTLKGFFNDKEYMGGVRRFRGVPLSVLKSLISEGFVDIDDKQNNAPTIGEMVALAEQMEQKGYSFFFGGYAVSDTREDYRISIDTIMVKFFYDESNHLNNKIIKGFFKDADTIEEGYNLMLYWYD